MSIAFLTISTCTTAQTHVQKVYHCIWILFVSCQYLWDVRLQFDTVGVWVSGDGRFIVIYNPREDSLHQVSLCTSCSRCSCDVYFISLVNNLADTQRNGFQLKIPRTCLWRWSHVSMQRFCCGNLHQNTSKTFIYHLLFSKVN